MHRRLSFLTTLAMTLGAASRVPHVERKKPQAHTDEVGPVPIETGAVPGNKQRNYSNVNIAQECARRRHQMNRDEARRPAKAA